MMNAAPSLVIEVDAEWLRVGGLPPAAATVRVLANGMPCWSGRGQEGGGLEVPLASLAWDMAAGWPSEVPLTVLVFDASGGVVARAGATCAVPVLPARREEGETTGAAVRAGGGRLVASMLHGPGEAHAWRFRVADAVGMGEGFTQVFFRIACEASGPLVPTGAPSSPVVVVAEVTWRFQPKPASAEPRSKRARLLSAGAWGEQTVVTRITPECRDAAFLCVVPDDAIDSQVSCHVAWLGESPVRSGTLRYAVHGQAVQPAVVPPALLAASSAALPEPVAPTQAPAPAAPAAVEEQPPGRPGQKLAVLCGVSKYSRRPRGDLEWCDEDVTTWYEYLTGLGYVCRIYGDEFSPFPQRPASTTLAPTGGQTFFCLGPRPMKKTNLLTGRASAG